MYLLCAYVNIYIYIHIHTSFYVCHIFSYTLDLDPRSIPGLLGPEPGSQIGHLSPTLCLPYPEPVCYGKRIIKENSNTINVYIYIYICIYVYIHTYIQYNTIQYNRIQYSTIQYNTIHYNTIQYNTYIHTLHT